MQDYSDFACQIQNSEIFEKVIIGRLPNPDLKLAADNRHFLTDSLVYDDLTSRKSFGSKNFLEYCTKEEIMKYLMIILSFFAFFGLTAYDPMGDGKA